MAVPLKSPGYGALRPDTGALCAECDAGRAAGCAVGLVLGFLPGLVPGLVLGLVPGLVPGFKSARARERRRLKIRSDVEGIVPSVAKEGSLARQFCATALNVGDLKQ